MDIRKRIDELRKEKGWSRSELAHKLEISYTALKNWYNGKDCMPALKTVYKVCTVFGMTSAELFADAEEDRLSADQIAWLELYLNLSDKQKKTVLALAKSLAEE